MIKIFLRNLIFLLFISPFLHFTIYANSHEEIIEKKINSLKKKGINNFIVYGEYYNGTFKNIVEKTVIIYSKKSNFYGIIIKSLSEKRHLKKVKISSSIFDIYRNNHSKIDLLLNTEGFLIDTIEYYKDGTFMIEKKGTSHGMSIFLKIINPKYYVQNEYCCGVQLSYFQRKGFALWLLITEIKKEFWDVCSVAPNH